jgi:hypothetical protein
LLLIATILPTWNYAVVKAVEPKQEPVEVALPVKKISDYYVNGYIRKNDEKGKITDEREPYEGLLSKKPDYRKEEYNSIFTRFADTRAQINEDAGEGNIITKIEFLKGDEVAQTKIVNARSINEKVKLNPENVPVESVDNKSPSGATLAFKLVGTKWQMWKTSSWMQEDKSQRVTPSKIAGTNIDAYPGT